jgi:hypothetical protein
MDTPFNLVRRNINGVPKRDIARRTVPCYKYVLEDGEEVLSVCLLVDSKYLYRYPFEKQTGFKALATKARYLKGEMEDLRLREFQPGICRYVHPRGESKSA